MKSLFVILALVTVAGCAGMRDQSTGSDTSSGGMGSDMGSGYQSEQQIQRELPGLLP